MLGSLNLFAYCNNAPTNYVDPKGKDAILLYDQDFPTHIGALIQDENGNWLHFYWGTAAGMTRILCVSGVDVPALTWCVSYSGDLTLNAINASQQFSGNYEDMMYLNGDFSYSAKLAQNPTGNYNLYTNNCSQMTLSILAKAETQFQSMLANAAKRVLPVSAFRYLTNRRERRTHRSRSRSFYQTYTRHALSV